MLSPALFHQLLSDSLRLLHTQREIHIFVHDFLELWRQSAERLDLINLSSPPLPLLWRDIGRGWDFDVWVHEKKRQQLAVPRFRCFGEFEGKNAVLEYVRKDE